MAWRAAPPRTIHRPAYPTGLSTTPLPHLATRHGGFSARAQVAYSAWCPRASGGGPRPTDRDGEHGMTRGLFAGFFTTLAFVVVVLAGLFGIFTLVSYLAGPVGG